MDYLFAGKVSRKFSGRSGKCPEISGHLVNKSVQKEVKVLDLGAFKKSSSENSG
jgi:hypothetical protein